MIGAILMSEVLFVWISFTGHFKCNSYYDFLCSRNDKLPESTDDAVIIKPMYAKKVEKPLVSYL